MKRDYNLTELKSVAKELIDKSSSKTLLFFGAMGVGKTTLIKELCKELGIQDVANSPTFSLVNEYRTKADELVYHFDFYRIEDETEAYDMGIEEYFYSNAWCFVEWPEHIENLLPLDAAEVHIEMLENGLRSIQLKNKA
ncbi:tRNA (adenosine(37)-N6)-threonylcarbamoyltransferase complex ATPase subunit type 1 TsaE [Polaribacter pacificus]|uniref:tRNA threonylcarbamoyladenosine biosynthesis protein TsaE n=1 Tax=Polaribacter pacificus TaxID=1775173 RepID=A0A917HZN3_9FLAO|nr:tRNA (adenosine(37)-N6)-threonylcarbamoyltransferase complex ATPase subunit type 1 TsaE [Polaribacter pacificus]GGG98031.1 tRNA (adenosine(37)-N6)-threonylcarbamoyltransferase complex ATPase subunit type 1 TsaE [Polaribacter pacificus]